MDFCIEIAYKEKFWMKKLLLVDKIASRDAIYYSNSLSKMYQRCQTKVCLTRELLLLLIPTKFPNELTTGKPSAMSLLIYSSADYPWFSGIVIPLFLLLPVYIAQTARDLPASSSRVARTASVTPQSMQRDFNCTHRINKKGNICSLHCL